MVGWNLVEEPCLAVQRGGQRTLVSVADALTRAHEIDDLALPRPTLVPAVLRQLLLPLLVAALDIPRSDAAWAERWRAGRFDAAAIGDYLDLYRECFDLFSPERPFGQVAGLESVNGERKPSSLLNPAIASGNNVPLFSTRTEADPPPLSPVEALYGLLYTLCWDTAGIKTGAAGDPRVKGGKTTGNVVGPLGDLGVLVLIGRNLFETLMLNTPVHPDRLPSSDRPQWRADPPGPAWVVRQPLGLLDLFTWQARRVRLFPTIDARGDIVIQEVVVAAGDRLELNPDLEPHTAWTLPDRDGEAPRPRRLRPGRNVWQGLDGLLAIEPQQGHREVTSGLLRQAGGLLEVLGEDYPLSVLAVGVVYGTQRAVVEHVVSDQIPVPLAALRQDADLREFITQVVQEADDLGRAINGLAADLRRALGAEPLPWDRGQRPDVELIHELDPYVRRLLVMLQEDPRQRDQVERAWKQVARRAALRLLDRLMDALPPRAFAGRFDEGRGHIYRPANAERFFKRRVSQILSSTDQPTEDDADVAAAS